MLEGKFVEPLNMQTSSSVRLQIVLLGSQARTYDFLRKLYVIANWCTSVKALEFVQKRCEENETPAVVNMSFSVSDPNNDITTLDKTVVAVGRISFLCDK